MAPRGVGRLAKALTSSNKGRERNQHLGRQEKENKLNRARQIRILYVNSRTTVMMAMMMPGKPTEIMELSDEVGTNALFKAKEARRREKEKKHGDWHASLVLRLRLSPICDQSTSLGLKKIVRATK